MHTNGHLVDRVTTFPEDKINEAIRETARRILTDLLDRMVEVGKEHSPSNTGHYRRTIKRGEIIEESDGFSGEFGSDHPAANAIEWGSAQRGQPFVPPPPMVSNEWETQPPGKRVYQNSYAIRPRNKKALRFVTRSAPGRPPKAGKPIRYGKNEVFATEVRHFGVPPQAPLRSAIDIVRLREAETIIRRAVETELGKRLRRD